MSTRIHGTVTSFNDSKGYGYLEIPGRTEIFVHYTDIDTTGFKTLAEGMKVSFVMMAGGERGARAAQVRKETDGASKRLVG